MYLRVLGLSLAPFLLSTFVSAVPVANPDTETAFEDEVLNIDAASGVLSNDSGTGALSAVLVSDVSNGTLSLNPDGSFTYVPDENFNGTDTFTYRTSESPTGGQVFTVDQNRSSASVDATVRTGFGNASDDETTALKGDFTVELSPPASPFGEIHITDLNVTIAEAVSLNFPLVLGHRRCRCRRSPRGAHYRNGHSGCRRPRRRHWRLRPSDE